MNKLSPQKPTLLHFSLGPFYATCLLLGTPQASLTRPFCGLCSQLLFHREPSWHLVRFPSSRLLDPRTLLLVQFRTVSCCLPARNHQQSFARLWSLESFQSHCCSFQPSSLLRDRVCFLSQFILCKRPWGYKGDKSELGLESRKGSSCLYHSVSSLSWRNCLGVIHSSCP